MLKKILPFIFLFFITAISANGQVQQILEQLKPKEKFAGIPVLAKGSQVLQIGIGTPNSLATYLDFGGIANVFKGNGSVEKNFGPLFLNYEYFLRNNFGIGAAVSFASSKQKYDLVLPIVNTKFGTANGSVNVFQIGVTTSYHIYTTDKLDPYFKGGVGLNIWHGSYTDESGKESKPFTAPTPFSYQGLIGLRYFISKKMALIGETSYSNLKFTANFGTAIKL